jgi:hypothetical protein
LMLVYECPIKNIIESFFDLLREIVTVHGQS